MKTKNDDNNNSFQGLAAWCTRPAKMRPTHSAFPSTSLLPHSRTMLAIKIMSSLKVQVDLVICGLFIFESVYLQLQIDHFSGTYPPIYSHSWSFYMPIHYMRAWFFGPYLSHKRGSIVLYVYSRIRRLTNKSNWKNICQILSRMAN